MLTELEQQIRHAGYVRSPNYPDTEWYASGPGILEPKRPYRVHVLANTIEVRGEIVAHFSDLRTRFELCAFYHPVVASFRTVVGFLTWCAGNGRLSEPGLPAFYNSWD